MKVGVKIGCYRNKKKLVFLMIIVALILTTGFLIDDSKYWKSLFGFDKGDKYTNEAIEMWDQYGCSCFYPNEEEKALQNYESMLKDEKIVDYVYKNTAIYSFIHPYSKSEIENVFNAIVYGCRNREHDSGKYKSVADIPERLFRNCYMELILCNEMDKGLRDAYENYVHELEKGN